MKKLKLSHGFERISKKRKQPQGPFSLFGVGMQHSPKAKQDSVCVANIEDWKLTGKEKEV